MAWTYEIFIILRDNDDALSLGITKKIIAPLLSLHVSTWYELSVFKMLELVYFGRANEIEFYIGKPYEHIAVNCGSVESRGHIGVPLIMHCYESTMVGIRDMCWCKNLEVYTWIINPRM